MSNPHDMIKSSQRGCEPIKQNSGRTIMNDNKTWHLEEQQGVGGSLCEGRANSDGAKDLICVMGCLYKGQGGTINRMI